MLELRDYQTAAVEAVYKFFRTESGNPCVVIPTGGGKTPVIAKFCYDAVCVWNSRVLVVAHVKELLEQSAKTIHALCPMIDVGVYSAGLKQRDTKNAVLVAGIQSVYNKAELLGFFDIMLIDEAQLIPESGDGQYRRLISDLQEINPDLRIIGLTATPYRLSSGAICTPEGVLNKICYEISVKVLINRGFLSKMTSKAGVAQIDTSKLKIVRGEFDQDQVEAEFDDVVFAATNEVIAKTVNRKSVLIFCQSIHHAQRVVTILRTGKDVIELAAQTQLELVKTLFDNLNDEVNRAVAADYLEEQEQPTTFVRASLDNQITVGEIYGDTPDKERARLIKEFREGKLKYLVNVNVLTTGFDAPNVDCVVLMRATVSAGLSYQMIGRGFRICPGKQDCLVLDFGENIQRHGPVDCITPKQKKGEKGERPGKICPNCRTVVSAGVMVCPDCGNIWESSRVPTHNKNSDGESDVVSGEPKLETYDVTGVSYKVHLKKGGDVDTPKTLRVEYQVSLTSTISEWICIEHPAGSFAHGKALQWWQERCLLPIPDSTVEANAIAKQGWLAPTYKITVKTTPGKPFPEIKAYTLGTPPTTNKPCKECQSCEQVIIPDEGDDIAPHPGRIVCAHCSACVRWASHDEVELFGVFDPPNDVPGVMNTRGLMNFGPEGGVVGSFEDDEVYTPSDSEDIPF